MKAVSSVSTISCYSVDVVVVGDDVKKPPVKHRWSWDWRLLVGVSYVDIKDEKYALRLRCEAFERQEFDETKYAMANMM